MLVNVYYLNMRSVAQAALACGNDRFTGLYTIDYFDPAGALITELNVTAAGAALAVDDEHMTAFVLCDDRTAGYHRDVLMQVI
jgi:hypothetical protein